MTDETLVEDVERFAVHFGGDTYYDSVILKQRVAENFEGTIKRIHVTGPAPQPDANGLYLYSLNDRLEIEGYVGGKAHVVSGPHLFETRTVVAIEERDRLDGREEKTHFIKLDRPVDWGTDWMNGLLLDNSDLTAGQMPWRETGRAQVDGQRAWVWQWNEDNITPDTVEVVSDTPPDVGGHGALLLKGDEGDSWVRYRVQFWQAAPYAGTWTAKLWTKARDGNGTVVVSPTVPGTSATIEATGTWQHHEVKLQLEPVTDGGNPIFLLQVEATDGAVIVDNIELSRDGDGSNPTAFRDELVDAIMPLKPGSMRYLRNHRDTYMNSVVPRMEGLSRRNENRRRSDFGIHEYYELMAHLGADPYDAISGTMLPEDIDHMMEYHAAPADVGMGRVRARLGQEKPWTEVFDKIHLQIGNEVATFPGTGYQGPDYWKALIDRAKASPWYDPDTFVFHINSQGGGFNRLLQYHTNFDRATTANYLIFAVYQDQIDAAGDIPGFYDWVNASIWHMWFDERNNRALSDVLAARQAGLEVSIYEGGNFHTTFGDPNNPPMERINRMMAGKAGGAAAINSKLLLLKHYGVRHQQNFNMAQERFRGGGAFGNLPEAIRGWGGMINLGNSDTFRYRPRFQALKIANEVIGGNLVKTAHTGDDDTFELTNRFGSGYRPSRDPQPMTVTGVPRLYSYGFAEGDRRALILVSGDPRSARTIEVQFDGRAASPASVWLLDSPGLEDTNEDDWAPDGPQVTIRSEVIADFSSGTTINLPPGTIVALEWTVTQ